MRKLIACALGLTLVAGAASAATIHLNENKGWTPGSHTYSNGEHSVKASAYEYSNYGDLRRGKMTHIGSWGGDHGGIGVHSCKFKYVCMPDKHTVDGQYGNEMVVFDFGSKVVRLTGVTLSYADRHDMVDVVVYNNGKKNGPTDGQYDIAVGNVSPQFVSVSGLDTGSVFGVGAFSPKSEFKIKKIHYSVVPLPAAGWLLLAGVGGLALVRRRKAA